MKMTTEKILQQLEDSLIKRQVDIDLRNQSQNIINQIPDEDAFYVKEKFLVYKTQFETNPDSGLWTLIDICLCYLSGTEEFEGYVSGLSEEAMQSNLLIFKDKEYWCEFLIEFEEIQALTVFLKNNPDYHNHYLIEKLLREFALSENEIGDLILNYLDHPSSFVRDAAFQYLEKKALQQYNAKMVKALETDHHDKFVVRHAIMTLKNTGELEIYKTEITEVTDRLIEKGWADKDFFDNVFKD